MLDSLRKLFLFGVGAIELTADNLRASFDELVKRGDLTEKEARELPLTGSSAPRAARDLQHQVEDAIKRQLERLAMARQRDLDALAGRVTALEAKLEELHGQTTRP